jgi:hypothetical protein
MTTMVEAPAESPAESMAESAAHVGPVEELERRGQELCGVASAATAALVGVIAEAIQGGHWQGAGMRSVEHWAGLRFGLCGSRARRLVGAARALADLPEIRGAFGSGELTEDHVAEIARAGVGPVHDREVLEIARHGSVSQLRHALSSLPAAPAEPAEPAEQADAGGQDGTPDEVAPAPARRAPRARLVFGDREDGTWGLQITGADPDEGALVHAALRAARGRLFRLRHGRDADAALETDVSWYDAFVFLARSGLDALDPATAGGPTGGAAGAERRPSERYLVNIHLPGDNPGSARIHLGAILPEHLRQGAGCDAWVRTWVTDAGGNVNLGRTRRVVDTKLRTVIEHRDGGCRVPGCDAGGWLVIHHIRHWEHGGPTDTANLLALCPAHHRAVHRNEIRIDGDADRELRITDSLGRPIGPGHPRPPREPPSQAARRLGVPEPAWRNRSGEPAQWRWLAWSEHPSPN